MRRLLILCFILLSVTISAAQDTTYRLVTPTANDYYNTLIEYGPEVLTV